MTGRQSISNLLVPVLPCPHPLSLPHHPPEPFGRPPARVSFRPKFLFHLRTSEHFCHPVSTCPHHSFGHRSFRPFWLGDCPRARGIRLQPAFCRFALGSH